MSEIKRCHHAVIMIEAISAAACSSLLRGTITLGGYSSSPGAHSGGM